MGFSNYRPVQTLPSSRDAGQGRSLPCSLVAARPGPEVGSLTSLTGPGPMPDRTLSDFDSVRPREQILISKWKIFPP